MHLTVIIPTYNRAQMVGRAIRSVLQQDCPVRLDILVVDDGSTDETAEVVYALMREHGTIRFVRQDHAGVATARNTGLNHLLQQTSFITFLDSDDVYAADRFTVDLAHLLDEPALDLIYARLAVTDQMDDERLVPPPDAKVANVVGMSLAAAIFRRELVQRTGLFDETLRQSEDIDYFLRIFESGSTFRQTDTLAFYHVRHARNMTLDRQEAGQCFARALLMSVIRRRNDPGRVLRMPALDMKLLKEIGVYECSITHITP